MKDKKRLKEEVVFWQGYISNWETRHTEPIPERAKQLLNIALYKLDSHYSGKDQNIYLQSEDHTLH